MYDTYMSTPGNTAKLGATQQHTDCTKRSVPGWERTCNALVSTQLSQHSTHYASQAWGSRMETRNFTRLHEWVLRKSCQYWVLSCFEIGCSSLRFVTKFSKKEKWFTNLVGDQKPNLRPIFPRWQCSLILVWK